MTAPTSEEVQAMCSRLRDRRELHQHCEDDAADLIERLARKVALYKAGNMELYDRLEARDNVIKEYEQRIEDLGREVALVNELTAKLVRAEQQRDEALSCIDYRVERVRNGEITAAAALDTLSRDPFRIRAMGADNDD